MKNFLILTAFVSLLTTTSSSASKLSKEDSEIYKKIDALIPKMSLEEKISLIHGNAKFYTGSIERLGIPALAMSDGPNGVREEVSKDSWKPTDWVNDSSTWLPASTALAATWNTDMAYSFGTVLGQEARFRGKDVILGPAINIHRTPLGGRNFEYMSEDPFLIAQIVTRYVKGVQDQDVAACAKHFAANNQEWKRGYIDVLLSERALQEIYFPGFKAAVRNGGALAVMGAYNKIRGQHCCHNDYILNKMLKQNWGFKGVVISDWNGAHSTQEAANCGLDIEMGTNKPFDQYFMATPLLDEIKKGNIKEDVVNDKVRRILYVMHKIHTFDKANQKTGSFNTPEQQAAVRKIAEEAIVLLKNENNALPLKIENLKSIAVIGDNATRKHAHTGGSCLIKAKYEITPLEAFQKHLGDKIKINFAQGYIFEKDSLKRQQMLKQAVEAAKKSDVAIIFGGLSRNWNDTTKGYAETEGRDRENMKMPYQQPELIKAVREANPNTIVVLLCGSPIEISDWIEKVPAVVQAWYAGSEAGNAIYNILTGAVNPSGKLPFTWPVKLEDSPAHAIGEYPEHPGMDSGKEVESYNEGIFVGYRYFDTKNVNPTFCFGHGLSYTQFKYSDLTINKKKVKGEPVFEVKLYVTNTGPREGKEVVQLYISDPQCSVERPLKELKGFQKIDLQPGEKKGIIFDIDKDKLSFFDEKTMNWKAEPGEFKALIGSSSRDIRLTQSFKL